MSTPKPTGEKSQPESESYFDASEEKQKQSTPETQQRPAGEDIESVSTPFPGTSQRASAPAGGSNSRSYRRARSSSIRIRRLPSSIRTSTVSATIPEDAVPDTVNSAGAVDAKDHADGGTSGRKRSSSAPEKRDGVPGATANGTSAMRTIPEGSGLQTETSNRRGRRLSLGSSNRPPLLSRLRSSVMANDVEDPGDPDREYEDEVANLLDVVDPEVSTLATLTNVQNSLFIPDLSIGRFSLINRRPTYQLTTLNEEKSSFDTDDELVAEAQAVAAAELGEGEKPTEGLAAADEFAGRRPARLSRLGSITSQLSETHFAVLPHGENLEGWTKEDRDILNDHVRHMLHSRRSKFKRGMRGFGKYVRRPLGFLVTLYAFLITVFGLIWVLLLIGWVSGGSDSRHKYIINIIDNVLVALFAIVGDGLAPFRAIDTYHMCFIAHYATTTWRKRREGEMPKLENRNDLPTSQTLELDPETGEKGEYSVLTPLQQKRLEHHQKKFARSHTYYKPHETTTHYAFSIRLLITITVLLDCHSLLQIALGAFTWSWNYKTRPAVITTVILCCSICANILAGALISVGDKRSRKTEVVEQMFRQALTQEAIKKVERHRSLRSPNELGETVGRHKSLKAYKEMGERVERHRSQKSQKELGEKVERHRSQKSQNTLEEKEEKEEKVEEKALEGSREAPKGT